MDVILDYSFAQQASRRAAAWQRTHAAGVVDRAAAWFGLQRASRVNRYRGNRRKLTQRQVDEVRAWAGRAGYGLRTVAQARRLQAALPHVSVWTLVDVLRNASWHDSTYVPRAPDVAYWRALPLVGHVVRAVARMQGAA